MNNIPIGSMFLTLIGGLILITGCGPALASPTTQSLPTQTPPSALSARTPRDESKKVVTLRLSDWHLTKPHWEKAIQEMIMVSEERSVRSKPTNGPIQFQ